MITDPWFYATATIGTFLIGMSKSGFLPGIGSLGVPLMALYVSPVQAAAIQLPLLVATDWIAVWKYRREYDWANLRILLPSGVIGITAGWLTASWVSEPMLRVMIGVIGIAFTLNYWLARRGTGGEDAPATGPDWTRGLGWGALAAYTSFFAHAGGPAYSVYMLPQRLPNAIYAGTTLIFFATVNIMKVPPYFAIGQLSSANLLTSAVLFPVAWGATLIGIWLVRRVPSGPFYKMLYACQFLVSVKLLWDGVRQLMRG